MLSRLPASPINAAIRALFPDLAPGLKMRILRLWEHAANMSWMTYGPLPEREKENVSRHIHLFMFHLSSKRLGPLGVKMSVPQIVWMNCDCAAVAAKIESWLAEGSSSCLIREIQALLGRMDVPRLTRLMKAGARMLGVQPLLLWDKAAMPAPIAPRQWTRRWYEFETFMPGLARPFSAYLLDFLVAATIEAADQRSEKTPFTSLSTVMTSGAWPVCMHDPALFELIDVAAMTAPPRETTTA